MLVKPSCNLVDTPHGLAAAILGALARKPEIGRKHVHLLILHAEEQMARNKSTHMRLSLELLATESTAGP